MGNNGKKLIAALVVSVIVAVISLIVAIVALSKSGTTAPSAPAPQPTTPSTPPTSAQIIAHAHNMYYSMNISAEPCTDFYTYACGQINQKYAKETLTDLKTSTLSNMNNMIILKLAEKLTEFPTQYNSVQSIKQAKLAYDTCIAALNVTYTGQEVLDTFHEYAGGMPLLVGNNWKLPSNMTIERLMGILSAKFDANTLISWMVATNWKKNAHQMFWIIPPTLSLSNIYYTTNATWINYRPALLNRTLPILMALAKQSNSHLTSAEATAYINQVLDMEYNIANHSLPADKSRNYSKKYNIYNMAELEIKWPSIKWVEFLTGLGMDTSRPVGVTQPSVFDWLNGEIKNGTLNETFLVNYILWRYATNPDVATEFIKTSEVMEAHMNYLYETEEITQLTPRHIMCLLPVLLHYYRYPVSRLYIDDWISANPHGRAQVGGMVSTILNAFASSMIPKLAWMDDQTKQQAIWKANQIVKNIAYPDWMMNNTMLDEVYEGSDLQPADSYYTVVTKMHTMVTALKLWKLGEPTDRTYFGFPPAIVNAVYSPMLNSITFPAAILNSPMYSADFPMSVNYGGIGAVMGHELMHGFDDMGIQFNYNGTLTDWMDSRSNDGFITNVANCTQQEYSKFCYPASMGLDPSCVNGVLTQGENIADNGGIKAAYSAYQQYVQLNGAEAPLPAPMNRYTSEQLFFLSFAQAWCESTGRKKLQEQLLTDPHSPGKFRVMGTVQNFPAFGKAFNCSANSTMNPDKHCTIW